MTWGISKLLNWIGGGGHSNHHYYHHGRYNNYQKEPTQQEIDELSLKIKRFGSNIEVDEFKEQILEYTKKISDLYNLEDVLDVEALAESAYENYLARLYQIIKYINQNPSATKIQADIYLKFDDVNVVEFYPFLNSLIVFGDECTIGRRQNYAEKKNTNNTINARIYTYAKQILPRIKEQDKKNRKEKEAEQEKELEKLKELEREKLSREQMEKERLEKEQRDKVCQRIINSTNITHDIYHDEYKDESTQMQTIDLDSKSNDISEIVTTTGDYNPDYTAYGNDMSYETNMQMQVDAEFLELEKHLDNQLSDIELKPKSFNTSNTENYRRHKYEEEMDPLLQNYSVYDDDNAVAEDVELEDFNPHDPEIGFEDPYMIDNYY